MDFKLLKTAEGIQQIYETQARRFKNLDDVQLLINHSNAAKKISNDMHNNYGLRAKVQKIFRTACDASETNFLVLNDCTIPDEKFEQYIATLNKAELRALLKFFDEKNEKLEKLLINCEKERDNILKNIGNIVHDSVPISNNEDNNVIIKEWGNKRVGNFESHYDLLPKIGLDTNRGSKVAGNRGYFLTGDIARLQLAIISYATDFLNEKEYRLIIPPYYMNREHMSKVAQLEQFDEELYHVSHSDNKDDYKYLIATSEQPIASYYADEILDNSQLPLKYCGYSTNFRREAGSHGRECGGIFRVHQFDKIEQFVFCRPEESWNIMENMIKISEEFYQSLEIPYRIINIVSGALNNSASKKYDLEGWFPGSQTYRELVSCSNCTDYQSRNMNIMYMDPNDKNKKKYVHTLNSTLCALTRTICILCETHLDNGVVKLPKVLTKYFGNDIINLKN